MDRVYDKSPNKENPLFLSKKGYFAPLIDPKTLFLPLKLVIYGP